MSALRDSIADRVVHLSTRVQPSGGPVRPAVDDRDNLRGKEVHHLLILVHGFNNKESAAEDSYWTFIANVEEHFRRSRYAPDAIAFFYWPGDVRSIYSLGLRVAAYHFDIPQARESAQRLADYLAALPQMAGNPASFRITLIGHSLGCRLILEMLRALPTAAGSKIELASLLAPAVPVELVSFTGSLRATVDEPRKILKFFSRNDDVLRYAFPLGQWAAYEIRVNGRRIEDYYYREAVGRFGNPPEVGTPFETTNGHSQYWADADCADRYSAAIDPTFYKLPSPRTLASRSLAPTMPLESWRLPARN